MSVLLHPMSERIASVLNRFQSAGAGRASWQDALAAPPILWTAQQPNSPRRACLVATQCVEPTAPAKEPMGTP